MEITIDIFDPQSIEKACAQLDEYAKSLEQKDRALESNLADKGAALAQTIYSGISDWTLDETPRVHTVHEGKASIIEATGREVGFAEFGTGINNPEWSGIGSTDYTPPAHGTYGKKSGANPDGWYYKGKKTYGLVASEAMLTARDEIVAKAVETARRVFSE